MFCPKCGAKNEDAQFCRQCGTSLTATTGASHDAPQAGPKLAGWLLVGLGLATAFLPDAMMPQEGSKLLAFVLMTGGFGLVLSGASAIRRFGAGCVAAAVIVFPLYYLRSTISGNVATTATATATDVPLSVLLFAYSSNEVAADQQYKGHVIRTSGVVGDIKKDLFDKPFVLLTSGDDFRSLQCALAASAVGEAVRLRNGEPLTVQGVVQGLMVNVQVANCTIVTDHPELAQRQPPTNPTRQDVSSTESQAPALEPQTAPVASDAPPISDVMTNADRAQSLGGPWLEVDGSVEYRVIELVGRPSYTQTESDALTWYYDNTPVGTVRVYFRDGVASLKSSR